MAVTSGSKDNILDPDCKKHNFTAAWLLPNGKMAMWNYNDVGHHFGIIGYLTYRKKYLDNTFGDTDLGYDNQFNDSILTYDAIANGLIRVSLPDNELGTSGLGLDIGRSGVTKPQLYTLYDIGEFIEKSSISLEADAVGEFESFIDIGLDISSNGMILAPTKSFKYDSLDTFSKRFINDIKANVQII